MTQGKGIGKAKTFYRYHEIQSHAKQTYEMDRRLAKEFDIKQVNERNNPFNYNTHRTAYKQWQSAYLKEVFGK